MGKVRIGTGLALAVLLLSACTTPKETFLQIQHRETYALQDSEISGLQFFISRDVLAYDTSDPESPASVVIIPVNTPGLVTEVGPDYLRVRFSEDGLGVYFIAQKTAGGDSVYWIATRSEHGGLETLKDLPRKVIRVPQGEYELRYGWMARLLVSTKGMEKLIEARTHLSGVKN